MNFVPFFCYSSPSDSPPTTPTLSACPPRCSHPVLTLNPAGYMHPPSHRSPEPAEDVVPLNPAATRQRPGLLLQDSGLSAAVHARGEGEGREEAEEPGRHLGHDGAEDLGRGVLAFPGHVLVLGVGHAEGDGGKGGGGGEGGGVRQGGGDDEGAGGEAGGKGCHCGEEKEEGE